VSLAIKRSGLWSLSRVECSPLAGYHPRQCDERERENKISDLIKRGEGGGGQPRVKVRSGVGRETERERDRQTVSILSWKRYEKRADQPHEGRIEPREHESFAR
jgi:hypothetical protein